MGMTLRTSEQQTEALRRQAAAEGRSMQAVALSAIDEYIDGGRTRPRLPMRCNGWCAKRPASSSALRTHD